MSFDLGVWYPDRPLTPAQAGERYERLCAGEVREVAPSPSIDAFYAALVARHPELDDVPEDRLDDAAYCPWSAALDRSPGHVITCCVWSQAEAVRELVGALAADHGLVLYDPQAGEVTFPPGDPR